MELTANSLAEFKGSVCGAGGTGGDQMVVEGLE